MNLRFRLEKNNTILMLYRVRVTLVVRAFCVLEKRVLFTRNEYNNIFIFKYFSLSENIFCQK